MLFTFKQLNKGLERLLFSQYVQGGGDHTHGESGFGTAKELSLLSKGAEKEYISRNQEKISSYLASIKNEKGSMVELKKLVATDKRAMEKLMSAIGLGKKEIVDVAEVAGKLENYLREAGTIRAETSSKLFELKTEVAGTITGKVSPEASKSHDEITKKLDNNFLMEFSDKNPPKYSFDVKGVQEILMKRGHKITVDGKFGPKSRTALKAEQEKIKKEMPVVDSKVQNPEVAGTITGKVSPEASKSHDEITKKLDNNFLMEFSDKNPPKYSFDVKGVQEILMKRGHKITVDGKFGPKSRTALKAEQEKIKKEMPVVDNKTQKPEVNNNIAQGKDEVDGKGSSATLYKTIERQPSSFKITFGTGESSSEKLKENINRKSFDEIIKGMSFQQLQNFRLNIVDVINKDYRNKDGGYSFNWPAVGSIQKVFEKVGYKADGVFGGIEIMSLVQLVEATYITQLRVHDTKNFKDKVGLMLDYNTDGFLDDVPRFYTKEKQFFDNIVQKGQLNNLLKNMGYSGEEEFNKALDNNYYAARRDFRDRIGTLLSGQDVLNPGAMLQSPTAMKEFVRYKDQLNKAIDEQINKYEKTKTLPAETKGILKAHIASVFLMGGDRWGAGVSFDVKQVNDTLAKIIDTVQIGVVDGIPGIGIAKTVYENGRVKIDVGAINFIPYVSGNVILKEGDVSRKTGQQLQNLNLGKSVDFGVGGVISPVGFTAGAKFGVVNENTRAGIEAAKKNYTKVLDNVFKDIKAGKTFENSSYKGNIADKPYYERLTGMYEAMGSSDAAITQLKEGAVNNYETVLYEYKGEGFKFSGIGAGVLFYAAGFIPYILPSFERTTTEWTQKETFNPTKGGSEFVESGLETTGTTELLAKLKGLENKFDSKSRYLSGSKDLLTTTNTLESRWKGLNQLAGKVAGLPEVLKNVKTDAEKMIVVSTVVQYMKKSKDFGNGNINLLNQDVEKYVATDRTRRRGFNTLLGFNTDKEADIYYKKLVEGKGKLGKTNIRGIGFDAASPLNVEGSTKGLKGMDTLYSNLSVITVNGEPLLVPVTDQKKIDGFTKKLNSSNTLPGLKQQITDGLKNGSFTLQFHKDPEGGDDRLLLTDKNGGIIPMIDVFQPNRRTQEIILIGVGNTHRWDKDHGKGGNGGNGGSEKDSSSGSGGNNSDADHGGGGDF